ncbi:hypothetical protein HDU76_010917 [Blyttiomyces sp. JEL0837]|nr:hypothetical protein HDU76_010917 [Blyttiomyces sp. JEL0837]
MSSSNLNLALPAKPAPSSENDRVGVDRYTPGSYSSFARRDSYSGGSDRKRRERSDSPPDDRRKRRRSPSPRGRGGGDGDHYVPNYERDGYVPAPRHGGNTQPAFAMMGGGGFEMFTKNVIMGPTRVPEKKIEDPLDYDFLLGYKQFAEYTRQRHRGLDEDEMRKRFQQYREGYQSKILRAFFEEHKENEWFKEKYHPVDSKLIRDDVAHRKKEYYDKFIVDLNEGKYDDVCFNDMGGKHGGKYVSVPAEDGDDTAHVEPELKGDDGDAHAEGKYDMGLSIPPPPLLNHSLFIKAIPPTLKREQLIELCKDFDGFDRVLLSDPRSDKQFCRLGWVIFRAGTDVQAAMTALNGKKVAVKENEEYVLSLAPNLAQQYRTRALPAEYNTPERLEIDLGNVRRLARALDMEAGLNEVDGAGHEVLDARLNDFIFNAPEYQDGVKEEENLKAIEEANEAKDLTGVDNVDEARNKEAAVTLKKTTKRLDLYIEYLRRVHWYDYYSGVEADGPEDFGRRTWVHLRRPIPEEGLEPEEKVSKYYKSDFQRLSERLDSRVTIRTLILSDSWGGEELERLGGKNPESEVEKGLSKFVAKIDAEKYRCTDCNKLFRGEEFVKKHIKSKHPGVLDQLKVEAEFYNNYVKDPNRVHAAPNPGPAGAMAAGTGLPNPAMAGFGMPNMMAMNMGMGWPMMPPIVMPPITLGMKGPGGFSSDRAGGMSYGSGRSGGRGGDGYGDRYDRGRRDMHSRLGPPGRRDDSNLPVDPRARSGPRAYNDLDTAPKGDIMELDYD